jgi:hypothetical protein
MTSATTVNVLLAGGPSTLSDEQRIVTVTSDTEKVKLKMGRGYEHFSDTGESTDHEQDSLRVFQWCDRTAIAE